MWVVLRLHILYVPCKFPPAYPLASLHVPRQEKSVPARMPVLALRSSFSSHGGLVRLVAVRSSLYYIACGGWVGGARS